MKKMFEIMGKAKGKGLDKLLKLTEEELEKRKKAKS